MDDDDLAEVLNRLVKDGSITATCTTCKRQLSTTEHDARQCRVCSVFDRPFDPIYEIVKSN